MPRLDQRAPSELRLRLRSGGGVGVPRLTRADVEALIDEVEECWAGELPDWAEPDQRTDAVEYDNDGPPPMAHILAIEKMGDRAVSKAGIAHQDGKHAEERAWIEIATDIFNLAEELQDGEEARTEEREEHRCADVDVACGEQSHPTRCAGRNPAGPATAKAGRR